MILNSLAVWTAVTVAIASSWASAGPLRVERPTVNGRLNPLGIPADDVTVGWAATADGRNANQVAYHVRVGTAPGQGDVWDTGRIASDRQVGIALPAGIKLKPATRYFWQVRTWQADGSESDWNEPAWFETGLLNAEDWSGAEWVADRPQPAVGQDWTNYTAEVEFNMKAIAVGVLLRASDDGQSGYMLQIKLGGASPQLIVHTKRAGQYAVIGSVDLAPLGFTNDQLRAGRHTLTIELVGQQILTRLDRKTIDSRTDATFARGTVGLRTYGKEHAAVYALKVMDAAGTKTLLDFNPSEGLNVLSAGNVKGDAFDIEGDTDAVYNGVAGPLPRLRGTFTAKRPVSLCVGPWCLRADPQRQKAR